MRKKQKEEKKIMTSMDNDELRQIINKNELWPVSLQKIRYMDKTYLEDDEAITKMMRNTKHERDRHQITKPIDAHEQNITPEAQVMIWNIEQQNTNESYCQDLSSITGTLNITLNNEVMQRLYFISDSEDAEMLQEWLSSELDSRENEKRPMVIIDRLICFIVNLGLFKYYQIIRNRDSKTNRTVGNLLKTVEIHENQSEFEERYIYKYAVAGSAASIVSNLSDVIAVDADGDYAISKLMNLSDTEVGLTCVIIVNLLRRILIWSMMKGEIAKCNDATNELYDYFRHVNYCDDRHAGVKDKFAYVLRQLDVIRTKGTEFLGVGNNEMETIRESDIRKVIGEPMRSYKHASRALSVLLTDDKGFCELCKCRMGRHMGMRIMINTARRRTIDVQCKLNGNSR